ncbi:glycosyltransferase [Candidatus Kaiserbacteria bacterium]|nr:glycosyltransferase [Candidatus Kaiserbacteria bacterium]
MERGHKKVCAIIPCFNEAAGIARVIERFPREKLAAHGYELDIIVVDNASTDKTADIARSMGATVIVESRKGKGNAMRTGFRAVPEDAHYVIMLDGDDTYRPEEMVRLLELLDSGFCDAVVGSRLGGKVTDNRIASSWITWVWMCRT